MTSDSKLGISQKEYLKRYLSNDKHEKKKKKRKIISGALKRSKVIDDDIDLKSMRALDDDEVELYQLDEDAPQIAGIIDERPADVQAMEYYNNTKRWKVFGAENGDGDLKIKDNFDKSHLHKSKVRCPQDLSSFKDKIKLFDTEHHKGNNSDQDMSPPRKSTNHKSRKGSDSDLSPPRPKHIKSHSKSKHSSDSDLSPSRSKHKQSHKKSKQSSDSDLSPRRSKPKQSHSKSKHSSDSDLSPPRSKHKQSHKKSKRSSDSDLSPPRKSSKQFGKESNRNSDSDISPPRREKYHSARGDHGNRGKYADRKSRYRDKEKKYDSGSEDYSHRKKNYDDSRYSRSKDHSADEFTRKGKDIGSHKTDFSSKRNDSKHKKMEKTLDGKQAGLQDAKQLKKELDEFKEKEDKMFSKLASDLSGKGAETIMRDRKTGLKRDLDKERRDALEKAEKSAKENEKYSRWGKGIKQVEEAAEKFANAVHEMSKPLARYADDDDLDRLLKAQERDGDPMLDYIRKKQSESIPLTERKPVYQGQFLPNRFGIRPGYRWDGVDRSSGYEKQWFATQNNRRARDDEAYKWSISDM